MSHQQTVFAKLQEDFEKAIWIQRAAIAWVQSSHVADCSARWAFEASSRPCAASRHPAAMPAEVRFVLKGLR